MPEEKYRAGLYERAVGWITEKVKPSLNRKTDEFVAKSIDEYAKDNPRFADIIKFEVNRRGKGAGLTQDVAEPLLWTGIKTAVAVPIAVLAHYAEHGKFKMIGYGAALGVLLNNAIEVLRVVPRFTAGLQGSLEMAKDRARAIETTGIDPFSKQEDSGKLNMVKEEEIKFSQTVQKKSPVVPVSLSERAEQVSFEKTL